MALRSIIIDEDKETASREARQTSLSGILLMGGGWVRRQGVCTMEPLH